MTRGKYAARAANARAENARDTAGELRTSLAAERAASATERAEFQRQIARLEATLRREVDLLALEKVAALAKEHGAQLASLRMQVQAAEQAVEICRECWNNLTDNILQVLHDLGFTSIDARNAIEAAAGRGGLFTDKLDAHYARRPHLDPGRVRVLQRVRDETYSVHRGRGKPLAPLGADELLAPAE